MTGSADYGAAREAMAGIVLFGHVVGGVDKPGEGVADPAPDPRPQRPTGSADQGMRGTSRYDPREQFALALQQVFR